MSLVVISVGTSLLKNNVDHIEPTANVLYFLDGNNLNLDLQTRMPLLEGMRDIQCEIDANGKWSIQNNPFESSEPLLEEFIKAFLEMYLDESILIENIRKRSSRDPFAMDASPAEISSLFLYYYKPPYGRNELTFRTETELGGVDAKTRKEKPDMPRDSVRLLCTATLDSVMCAVLIREMIDKIALFSSQCKVDEIVIVSNLDHYCLGGSETIQSGLNALNDYFNTLKSIPGKKILNSTGGYKEFTWWLKGMAMNYRFVSIYLFERSYHFEQFYFESWPQRGIDSVIKSVKSLWS